MQYDFLSRQDGFVKRILLKNEGRTYTALVYWESLDAAHHASEHALENESVRTFAASFKPETFRMDWFIPVKEWEKGR
jgi:heme-degrading monooxygenase HmoA